MQTATIPNQIIEDLKAGNERFLEGKSVLSPAASLAKLKEYAATGQVPKAIVLCCSDSRGPVEMIFDQDLGDLFVIRVAGNIIAPSLVGSVEFAAATFGISLVVVMGHTQCGAISATLNHMEHSEEILSENLRDIVSRIKPHLYALSKVEGMERDQKMHLAVEANVVASVKELWTSSRLIEERVKAGQIKIVGAVLELSSGRVRFLED